MKIVLRSNPFPRSKVKHIVLHGSNADFDAFSQSKPVNDMKYGPGLYFTDNERRAKNFGKFLYKCYLNCVNPFMLNDSYDERLMQNLGGIKLSNIYWYTRQPTDFKSKQQLLKNLGYDSIILPIKTMGFYLVFNPAQVRIIDKISNS